MVFNKRALPCFEYNGAFLRLLGRTVQMIKVLIVEDNRDIARQLGDFLSGLNWQIDFAENGAHAIRLATHAHFDVVLLDLNLPDMDGVLVCQSIKQQAQRNIPVLMLTARDAFEDKAQGFKYGADDYLTKPYDFREVVLRCQALTKRHELHRDHELWLGALCVMTRDQRAEFKGAPLALTQIGFKILMQLVQAHPNPVSRSQMIRSIWGDEPPPSDALKSHIYSLRKQLEQVSGRELLRTIHQIGYQLQNLGDDDETFECEH